MLPGNHVVKVTVANGLGNVSSALNVSVLYPVTIHHVTAKPVTLRQPFVLELILSGDLDFTLAVDYGDGSVIESSTSVPHPNFDIRSLDHSSNSSSAPHYLLELRHLYTTPGDYSVLLSVSNRVSRVRKVLSASVADDHFNVTLTSSCQSVTASNSLVTLSASVMVDDVSFSWMCGRCSGQPLVHR